MFQPGDCVDFTPTAARSAGEVVQLRDGRAGVCVNDIAAGVKGAVQVRGIASVAKVVTQTMLPSNIVFWDASANTCNLLHGGDADFFLGTVIDDAAYAGTTVLVNLNEYPRWTLTLEGGESIPVSTAGWPHGGIAGPNMFWGKFDLTAEAQKVDALSARAIATSTPGILQALINIAVEGDAASADFNVGLADDTHASNADTITSSLFCHIDGGSTNIAFESDNATAEVSATDSTVDLTARTPFLVTWDLRSWSDIQIYVNGANVLPNSTFTLAGVAGPLKLLAHMEKDANDTPGNMSVAQFGFCAHVAVDE